MVDVFLEVGIIIIIATVLAFLSQKFKQPSIVAYMIAGIVIGPVGLKLIGQSDTISFFSNLGIIFLLFIVGMQLDIKKLKDLGTTPAVLGIGQIIFTAFVGYFIAKIWFSHLTSLYIAIALTFSSTIIVVKILLDKNELSTLHGRTALGTLLIQDMIAIFAIVAFSTINSFTPALLAARSLEMVLFILSTAFLAYYAIPKIFQSVAQSRETLFLASLSWLFIVAIGAEYLHFSAAIGAFIAGITLANTPFSLEITNRIKPLRDFFVTIFFVSLGMQVTLAPLKAYAVPIFIFSLFVLVFNPVIMLILSALFGYHKRTAFLTSLCLAQISEFSLVFVSLGVALAHITEEIFSIITTVAIITLGISTYFITYNEQLYKLFSPLMLWESRRSEKLIYSKRLKPEVLLCGYNRMGYAILRKLKILKKSAIAIDYNPNVIKKLASMRVPCLYGDVTSEDVFDKVDKDRLRLCISTIPNREDNIVLIKRLKKLKKDISVVVTGNDIRDAFELYKAGADYVILPHFVGGDHFAVLIDNFNLSRLKSYGKKHLAGLSQRKKARQN